MSLFREFRGKLCCANEYIVVNEVNDDLSISPFEVHAGHQLEQIRLLGFLPAFECRVTDTNATSLTGKEVAAPPLDVNDACVMNSLDKHCIGEGISVPKTHPFHGYYVSWPGTRLPSGVDASNVIFKVKDGNPWNINWSHVYYLAKPDDDTAGIHNQVDSEEEEDLQYLYLTALRTLEGDFIPLPTDLLPHTMTYATPNTIPISNMAVVSYYNVQRRCFVNVRRQFCDSRHYTACYQELILHKTVNNMELLSKLIELDEVQKNKRRLLRQQNILSKHAIHEDPSIIDLTGPNPFTINNILVDDLTMHDSFINDEVMSDLMLPSHGMRILFGSPL